MRRDVRSVLVLASLLTACGNPSPAADASDARTDATDSPPSDSPQRLCTTDFDCGDSIFCNGAERCMPGAAGADSRGCVAPASPACAPSQTCIEASARCETRCTVNEDADGDGHRAIACGGDDCDDADPQRFPGNAEMCDAMHDEDCDPLTVGARDTDNDGYLDRACCNRVPGTNAVCGLDCNDSDMTIHPDVPEVCNAVDDNCNGLVDEGVSRLFFPDADGDGYGARGATPITACMLAAGQSENSLDCDDSNAAISPVATEACNTTDDNCNGLIDEAPASALACAASYGMPANTTFACTAGNCTVTCPAPYADCDGRLDNGCETNLQTDVNHCGACGTACGVGGTCSAGTCDHIVEVSAGVDFTCARRSNGLVVCWGSNDYGQLGDGSGVARALPTVVPGVANARAIGVSHSDIIFTPQDSCPTACAQHGNALVCWGCNNNGQVGNGSIGGIVTTPSGDVLGLPHISLRYGVGTVLPVVGVGGSFTCAAENGPGPGGGAECFGNNSYMQLGRTTTGPSPTPDFAGGTFGISWVTTGMAHACHIAGRDAAGSPLGPAGCWGWNVAGQSGAPTSSFTVPYTAIATPTGVGATSFVQIEAGYLATCARAGTAGRQVLCWGANGSGQLGDGTTTPRYQARLVPGVNDAIDLAIGGDHACIVRSDGRVACWGSNRFGQLGTGTTTDSTSPTDVPGITDAIDVSTSIGHTCVVHASGRVSCWGHNHGGQLGDETRTDRSSPTQVHGL